MRSGRILAAQQGDVCLIKLEGSVTHTISGGFDLFITGALENRSVTQFVIDLRDVVHIDSTNLGLLARIARNQLARGEGSPVLVSVNADVNTLLKSMGFDAVFVIVECSPADVSCCREIPERHPDRAEQLRTMLDAHRTLMELNKKNRATFRTVVEALEADAE